MTLAELCDCYLKTIQHQKPKTIERKTLIVQRIKRDWPTGAQTQVGKIKPSDVDLWIAQYEFGPASRNLHVVRIDGANHLLLVRGAVPGPNGGLVMVRPTNKRG